MWAQGVCLKKSLLGLIFLLVFSAIANAVPFPTPPVEPNGTTLQSFVLEVIRYANERENLRQIGDYHKDLTLSALREIDRIRRGQYPERADVEIFVEGRFERFPALRSEVVSDQLLARLRYGAALEAAINRNYFGEVRAWYNELPERVRSTDGGLLIHQLIRREVERLRVPTDPAR